MVELVTLSALVSQGNPAPGAPTTRNFTAVIQHIASSKRMRLDRISALSRVATYHVIHLADPTKMYFKLLWWGNALPTLEQEEQDGEDTMLYVGDMVLFSGCTIKSFRGNVEAQYTRHSRVQLLYRKDRYFNTRDVRLKDFYPMIDWYKKHRHQFLLATSITNSGGNHNEPGNHSQVPGARSGKSHTPIRDLREDMLANINCTIHEHKSVDADAPPTNQTNSSEYDGVQLCEVVMKDANGDMIVLNLWDQYADPRFVARLLAHRGSIEVNGAIISQNAVAKRLLANSTPRTEFRFPEKETALQASTEDYDHEQQVFSTVDAVITASFRDEPLVLDNVVIEHAIMGCFLGKSDRVQPAFTPLLVECYCSVCGHTLPVVQTHTIPLLYASCKSRCRVKYGESERKWRYRTAQIVLRDAKQGRLTVDAGSAVLKPLLGNIDAETIIHPHGPGGTELPFDPRDVVATCLNAIVQQSSGACQLYRVELARVVDAQRFCTTSRQPPLNDSVRLDEAEKSEAFAVVTLEPHLEFLW